MGIKGGDLNPYPTAIDQILFTASVEWTSDQLANGRTLLGKRGFHRLFALSN
jgi:hypothetical protein